MKTIEKTKCCIDCGKAIKNFYAKRCRSCAMKELFKNPENCHSFKHGETLKKHYCIDCDREISYRAKRCRACANRITSLTDGRTLKKYYCKDCGKELENYMAKRCQSCAKKGEGNPNFNNWSSLKPYPLGWTKAFKEQIRFRDGYKCQICECPEVECNKKLFIHHIDYNKENLNPDNLTSLCNSCHSKTNHNRDYWFAYFMYKIGVVG